jgi:hypothetical protein
MNGASLLRCNRRASTKVAIPASGLRRYTSIPFFNRRCPDEAMSDCRQHSPKGGRP